MNKNGLLIIICILFFCSCKKDIANVEEEPYTTNDCDIEGCPYDTLYNREIYIPREITIEKDFIYDKYTLDDIYPYKDTTRQFQWDKIRSFLMVLDSVQEKKTKWGIIQNRRNKNGKAPLIKDYRIDSYNRVADNFGVEQYQSAPLYSLFDSVIPERYGRDGSLFKFINENERNAIIELMYIQGTWTIPSNYIKPIQDSITFMKVIFVDRLNQNIAILEKVEKKWLVRSMNKATTGLHRPPYQHETPLGIFVIQEKKSKMFFYRDGTTEIGGFAPYASRFSNGGYIHGVPVNEPAKEIIEISSTLGTTPRSHMCVRNATSHAKFVYDWAPIEESLVIVIE